MMKPNPNNFATRYFMGNYSIFYLQYYICDLTSNVKEEAVKEARMMVDYETKNWPHSSYYKKIIEIHEEILNRHASKQSSKPDSLNPVHNSTSYYSVFI